MKPEPLEGKLCKSGLKHRDSVIHIQDIKSAVEWLKEQLAKDDLFVDLAHIERRIDKAFKDVTK